MNELDKVKIIPAEKNNEKHKKAVLDIFNQNIEYFHLTNEPVSYKGHSEWWEIVFDHEYIYIVLLEGLICGYMRLTKHKTKSKEENEISLAFSKSHQNYNLGTQAYELFEKKIKKLGIKKIIARTEILNVRSQRYFEKNGFEKTSIRYEKHI